MDALSVCQKNAIVQYLKEHLQTYTVILFGSAAKGKLRPDSDIDIAILTENSYTPYQLFMAAGDLADKLKREVDLIDFNQASTVLKAQIVGSGVTLVDDKPLERQYAFMRALKEYAMLNEERKAFLTKMNFFNGEESSFDKGCHPKQNGNDSSMHSQNS